MTGTSQDDCTDDDRRIAADIEKYGCHVINVFDPEEKLLSFSYSIGIQVSTGAPEAIVLGVRSKLGHAMINRYNERVRRGMRYERSIQYPEFIEGVNIYIEPAKVDRFAEYTLGCTRFYKGKDYSVVQLIYPSTAGVWPWQKAASPWFKSNQPMLGRKHPYRR